MKSKTDTALATALVITAGLAIFLVALCGVIVVQGIVIPRIWSLLILPTFPYLNLHPLTFWQGAGLGIVIQYIKTHPDTSEQNKDSKQVLSKTLSNVYVTPFLYLLIAWVINIFLQ